MFFSKPWKGERLEVIVGCCLAAVLIGLVIAIFGSFWLGWFTPATIQLFAKVALATFVFCFFAAIIGFSEYLALWKVIPMMVYSTEEDEGDPYDYYS